VTLGEVFGGMQNVRNDGGFLEFLMQGMHLGILACGMVCQMNVRRFWLGCGEVGEAR
jgi:hypothetical protein